MAEYLGHRRRDQCTGPMEGTNNKIKTMQRQAYGYRNDELFQLKVPPLGG